MSALVTRLVKHPTGPVLVVLDDEEWGKLPRGVVRALRISVGDTYDPDMLREEADAVMDACGMERGLALVSSRERSRSEVLRALRRDGYPEDVAERVADRLEEIGAVDDARFASALTRTLSGSRGYGRRRIERELREAGVDDDLALGALGDHASEDDEAGRARERAVALARGAGGSVSRLAGRLARRGFAADISWRVAREVLGSDGDQETPEDVMHDAEE